MYLKDAYESDTPASCVDRPFGRTNLALPLGVAAAAGAALLVPALDTPAVAAEPQTSYSATPLFTDSAAVERREAASSNSSRSSSRAALPASDDATADSQLDLPMADPMTMATAIAEMQDTAQAQAAKDAKAEEKAKKKAEEKAKKEAEEKAKAEAKPEIVGTRYVTTALNVRTSPDGSARVVTTLDPADKVRITDANTGNWQQIMHDGQTRWVNEDFLSRNKPEESRDSGSEAPVSNGSCSNGTTVQGGTGPNGRKVHQAVCARFPSISTYGGNRGGGGNHGNGRALDIMVSGPLGWDVANFLRANAKALGVSEVIYEQKIWTVQRSSEGWRGMSNRGSATANHYDHVHVSTY